MKLKVLILINCESSKYIAKLFSLSIFSYNYIYDLAKLYVYQNKFIFRYINIQGFICPLKKKKLSEKNISFLNNKINKIIKKWSPVYNYFFPNVTE